MPIIDTDEKIRGKRKLKNKTDSSLIKIKFFCELFFYNIFGTTTGCFFIKSSFVFPGEERWINTRCFVIMQFYFLRRVWCRFSRDLFLMQWKTRRRKIVFYFIYMLLNFPISTKVRIYIGIFLARRWNLWESVILLFLFDFPLTFSFWFFFAFFFLIFFDLFFLTFLCLFLFDFSLTFSFWFSLTFSFWFFFDFFAPKQKIPFSKWSQESGKI